MDGHIDKYDIMCTLLKHGTVQQVELDQDDYNRLIILSEKYGLHPWSYTVTDNKNILIGFLTTDNAPVVEPRTVRGINKSIMVSYIAHNGSEYIEFKHDLYNYPFDEEDISSIYEESLHRSSDININSLSVCRYSEELPPNHIWYEHLQEGDYQYFVDNKEKFIDYLVGSGLVYSHDDITRTENRKFLIFSILRIEIDPYDTIYKTMDHDKFKEFNDYEEMTYLRCYIPEQLDPIDAFNIVEYFKFGNTEYPVQYIETRTKLFDKYNSMVSD